MSLYFLEMISALLDANQTEAQKRQILREWTTRLFCGRIHQTRSRSASIVIWDSANLCL